MPIELYIISKKQGIKLVHTVEIVKEEVKYAKEIIKINSLESILTIFHGSLFEPVDKFKYDLIFSNIAQMPLPEGDKIVPHDHGGRDGWEHLDKIISHSRNHLEKGGFLSLLVFDFLGVLDRRNPTILSLVERTSKNNLHLYKYNYYFRKIRFGGMTHNSLQYILDVYPYSIFYTEKSLKSRISNEKILKNINEAVSKGLYHKVYGITFYLK